MKMMLMFGLILLLASDVSLLSKSNDVNAVRVQAKTKTKKVKGVEKFLNGVPDDAEVTELNVLVREVIMEDVGMTQDQINMAKIAGALMGRPKMLSHYSIRFRVKNVDTWFRIEKQLEGVQINDRMIESTKYNETIVDNMSYNNLDKSNINKITIGDIKEFLVSNNTKYDLLNNNCQHFVFRFMKKFGLINANVKLQKFCMAVVKFVIPRPSQGDPHKRVNNFYDQEQDVNKNNFLSTAEPNPKAAFAY